jgi:dCTP deaminase
MILSGDEIQRRLGSDIEVDPFDPLRLNPNSYNLSLHDELLVYEEVVLDLRTPNRYRRLTIPEEGILLQPEKLYLGRTVEHTRTHNLVPAICSRSSLSRLGLMVTASGAGDVGFCGHWTLGLRVVQPLRIYPFIQVCQILYHELCGTIHEYTSDKYQDSEEIQPSRMHRELGVSENEQQLELDFDQLARQSR